MNTLSVMPDLSSTRMPERMSSSRADLDALLDSQFLAHVSVAPEGQPVVFPTLIARDGDRVLIHGSTGSRWMRALLDGAPACVTVTEMSGIVVARSAFESSVHYRSAMLFGTFTPVADPVAAQDVLTNRILPGRTGEVRPSTTKELAATMTLQMPIDQWSLRHGKGWPEDPDEDIDGDSWAGVIRFSRPQATAEPAPDLRAGIPVPESVTFWTS